jgi:hypothetical protein
MNTDQKCKCGSTRLADVSAETRDTVAVYCPGREFHGYLPDDMGLITPDSFADMQFIFCLNCGQIQGTWPLPETDLEKGKLHWTLPCVLIRRGRPRVILTKKFVNAHKAWLMICVAYWKTT